MAVGVALLIVVAIAVTALAFGRACSPQARRPLKGVAECPMRPMDVTDYTTTASSVASTTAALIVNQAISEPQDAAPLESLRDVRGERRLGDHQLHGRANPVVQGRRSTWWFYTEGDTVNRPNNYGYAQAWAFLPATAVTPG